MQSSARPEPTAVRVVLLSRSGADLDSVYAQDQRNRRVGSLLSTAV